MTIGPAPICIAGKCIHWRSAPPEGENYGFSCNAFPRGIPDEIIDGDNDHRVPLPGQGNDLVFTPGKKK